MAICRDCEDEFRVSTELLIQCAEDQRTLQWPKFFARSAFGVRCVLASLQLAWSVGSRGFKHPKALSLEGNSETVSEIFCRLFMAAMTMAFVNSSQAT